MTTSTSEMQNTTSDAMNHASEQCKEYIAEYPLSSTFLSFGAGFAIGVAIASAVGQSDSNRRNRFASSVSDQVMKGLSGWMPKSFRS